MKLTKSNRTYFNAAKSVAELSDVEKTKIGCVVVYKHKIISSGRNECKTNPLQKKYNKYRFKDDAGMHSLHAEIDALLPLVNRKDINFSNVSLYIYRQNKNGDLAISKPCPACESLIKSLGIRNLYYTGNNSYIHEELFY